MKEIFKIYLRDVKAVVTNYAAIIVVVALMILPSLYAWFNIKASWDPYGKQATSGIKVGVVNHDEGATINGNVVNLGDKVVDELKKNDQMGWQFVSEREARKALQEERFYAVITIPKNFSNDLTSIVSSDIKKGEIQYTVNEKMNAIAPKLTDKGVTSLQSMISETVVETVSNTIFEVSNEIGIKLEEQIPNITNAYEKLVELQEKFPEINETVVKADDGIEKLDTMLTGVEADMPKISSAITSANAFAIELKSFLTTAKVETEKISPMIAQDLSLFAAMAEELNGKLSALEGVIAGKAENAPAVVEQIRTQTKTMDTMVTSMIGLLTKLNGVSENATITSYIATLTKVQGNLVKMEGILGQISSDLANGTYRPGDKVAQLKDVSGKVSATLLKVKDAESKLSPAINKLFLDALDTTEKAQAVLQSANDKLPDAKELLALAVKGSKRGQEGLVTVKSVLPKAENLINEFVDKLKAVKEEANLKELVNLLKSDVTKRSGFLANPVEIKEERMFPIANYGTGMSPFYTVLSLWVGILLLVSILSVEAHGTHRAYQVYFGKLGLFLSITIIQALIVSLGDLYLLKITCLNPGVFVLGSVITSAAFTVIVYSLVSVWGNVGKVISIILLVLQVAGSGGTFPIQLTPRFFQVIHPFLPFTYCISFEREAIGGIVTDILRKDVTMIIIFVAAFVLFALLLKEPVNKLLSKFTKRFKESGIGAD